MASLCFFELRAKGSRENVDAFYRAMSHIGDVWIGRGIDANGNAEYVFDEEESIGYIIGDCKWSIQSSFIDDAVSMRANPTIWDFNGIDLSTIEVISLPAASKKWDLTIEAYSDEGDNGFQEHYFIKYGRAWIAECVDYTEYNLETFETREEAEEELELQRKITDEEWDSDLVVEGGFGEWDFSI